MLLFRLLQLLTSSNYRTCYSYCAFSNTLPSGFGSFL